MYPKALLTNTRQLKVGRCLLLLKKETEVVKLQKLKNARSRQLAIRMEKLTFQSATEGAVCHSTITDADIKSYSTNEVELGVTYNITVYATKTGYENSETATATLCWIDVAPKTEGITNGVASVRAMPVMIQSQGGVLNITGAPEGSVINVYDLSGKMVDSAISSSETTSIPTNLKSGEIGIVKIGDKSIKVVMQ